MSNLVYDVIERNESGKKAREKGDIPGVIYGVDYKDGLAIEMPEGKMFKLLSTVKNSMFSVNLNGKEEYCVVKEIQRDIYGRVIHVDFQNVNKDEDIKMKIPVIFNGEEKVIGKGLLLKALVSEVELYGESDEFPENIQYNVGDLDFGAKVFAKDLEIPEGFKLEIPENTLVATIGASDSAAEEEEEKTVELRFDTSEISKSLEGLASRIFSNKEK